MAQLMSTICPLLPTFFVPCHSGAAQYVHTTLINVQGQVPMVLPLHVCREQRPEDAVADFVANYNAPSGPCCNKPHILSYSSSTNPHS
jgi:hypothetical protein